MKNDTHSDPDAAQSSTKADATDTLHRMTSASFEPMLACEGTLILAANAALETLCGYSAHEVLGRDVLALFPIHAQHHVAHALTAPQDGELSFDIETRQGQHIAVEAMSKRLTLAGTHYNLLSMRRLSSQRGTQTPSHITKTNDAHNSLNKVMRASPSLIAISALEGGIHLDVNDTWLDVMGRTREDVIGRPVSDLNVWHNPKDRDVFLAILKSQGRVKDFDAKYNVKNGGVRDFSISAEIIEINNTPSMVIIGHDVTERNEAQKNATIAQWQAEDASKAKSMFLTNMSHELRTPLNAIMGFAEMISSNIFQKDIAPIYQNYADDIHASANHLLHVIEDVLDLSKIEAGRMEIHEEYFLLAAHFERVKVIVRHQADNNGIHVKWPKLSDDLEVYADPLRIKQALINLITNAIKFSHRGSEVLVECHILNDGAVELIVEDNGCGMCEDELKRALMPFGHADDKIAVTKGGTGLGLPIAKSFIDLHGGDFNIVSAKDMGTKISFVLPTNRTSTTQK